MIGACVLVLLVFPLQHSSLGDSSPLLEELVLFGEDNAPLCHLVKPQVRLEASPGGRHARTSKEQSGSSGWKAEVELRSERAGWPRPFLNRNNPPPQWIHPSQSTSPVWFSVNAEESGHDIL